MISSKGQSLLVWGDVTQIIAVQMPHPEIGIAVDSGGAMAIKPVKTDRVIDHFHGGGWVAGSPDSHSGMLGELSTTRLKSARRHVMALSSK